MPKEFTNTDLWVIGSNIGIVIITVIAILTSVHEGHRHEEAMSEMDHKEITDTDQELAHVVHEVLVQEKELAAQDHPVDRGHDQT